MRDDRYETRMESGAGPSAPASGTGNTGDRGTSFGCCHNKTGDAAAHSLCGSIMRRHPLLLSVILALMGLTCLVVATGMIVGVLRCFRAA